MTSQLQSQIQRYDLPTCLLEVWSERSPLSEWADRPIAQNLRFRLCIKPHNFPQKIVKGRQKQFEQLIEAVATYVEHFLATDDIAPLTHNLSAPELPKLKLGTLQLFDLLTSLEQCTREIAILPSLELEVRRITPAWLKVAAVLVATVGITTSAVRLISPQFNSQPIPQLATRPSPTEEKVASSPIETKVPKPGQRQDTAIADKLEAGEKVSRTDDTPPLVYRPPSSPPAHSELPPSQAKPPIVPAAPPQIAANSSPAQSEQPELKPPAAKKTETPASILAKPQPPVTHPSPQITPASPEPDVAQETTRASSSTFGKDDNRAKPASPPIDATSNSTASGAVSPKIADGVEDKVSEALPPGRFRQEAKPNPVDRTTNSPAPTLRELPPLTSRNAPSPQLPSETRLEAQRDRIAKVSGRDIVVSSRIRIVRFSTTLAADPTASLIQLLRAVNLPENVSGKLVLTLALHNDRVTEVAVDDRTSTLKDKETIELVGRSLLNWNSPQTETGKIQLILEINPKI